MKNHANRTAATHWALPSVMLVVLGAVSGCHLIQPGPRDIPLPGPAITAGTPRELHKAILPDYKIEPPDILVIDAINLVPRGPYHLRTLDAISVQVGGTFQDAPIAGSYPIELGGMVNLGLRYGAVKVAGMTVEQAQDAIHQHLAKTLKVPQVWVSLASMAALQQITGQHLVGPDGKVTLGSYGSVSVVGLTIAEAKAAVEAHLSEYLENPEVSLNVFAYNSKVYYVVTQGAGLGDGVFRMPITGNETVLDAISQINGLDQVSSKRIWIARPGQTCDQRDQILPVDWLGMTQRGRIETNYQVLPGDRIYVAADRLVEIDNMLAKIIAPVERVFGFTLLGTDTATRLSGAVLRGGGNPQGGL